MATALHHEIAGDGPAVLLIHAGVADSRMWEPQWHALAQTHKVIRVDLPGFGNSPEPDGDFVIAEEVIGVLDAAGVDTATVVGASFGGLVALELATLHPQRVEALILLSPNFGGVAHTADFEAVIARENELIEEGDIDGAIELMVETWLGPHADAQAEELVRAMQRRAYELQLEATGELREVEVFPEDLPMPTVIVNGAHDLEFFQRVGEHLEQTMPNASRVVLDWAGHLPTLEHPANGLELLRASLARSR